MTFNFLYFPWMYKFEWAAEYIWASLTDGHKSIWARINAGWKELAKLYRGKRANVLYAKELSKTKEKYRFLQTGAANRVRLDMQVFSITRIAHGTIKVNSHYPISILRTPCSCWEGWEVPWEVQKQTQDIFQYLKMNLPFRSF